MHKLNANFESRIKSDERASEDKKSMKFEMGLRNALHSFDVDDDDGTGQTMGGHFRFGIQSGMQGKKRAGM